MKKMITTIFLILITTILTAPANHRAMIVESEPLYIYGVSDSFLRAVMKFESNYRADAINPVTGARGVLQILPVMIAEVNKYSDTRYTWDDAFCPYKSIEIWYKVMTRRNPEYYPDRAIRLWFGVGVQHDGKTWHWYYNSVMN